VQIYKVKYIENCIRYCLAIFFILLISFNTDTYNYSDKEVLYSNMHSQVINITHLTYLSKQL